MLCISKGKTKKARKKKKKKHKQGFCANDDKWATAVRRLAKKKQGEQGNRRGEAF